MCGIFGSVGRPPSGHGEVLRVMDERLWHRGPDDGGNFSDDHVLLGCRRLSIVDLAGGGQPFFSEDGSVVVVCNGEIFNHRAIRAKLAGRHRFRSDCDVEVIAHLYEERGMDLVHELNGQFAFAIYDRAKGVVFLARDHFGICPLYYRTDSDGLLFASEIKAILSCPGVTGGLDLTGLDQVLCLPSVVSPRTMFEGVRSVRPGHYLEIGAHGSQEHEYWDLDYPVEAQLPGAGSLEEHRESILDALRAAVHRRLIADVPVGLYVSGGLDSALVACLAAEIHERNVTHVLSVGFPHAELDETPYQRMVTDHLGYPHRHLDVTVDDICRGLERAVWHSEVPMRESYNVASMLLAETAHRNGMKAVLSGEGADELFAGYSGYRFDALRAGMHRDLGADSGDEIAARDTMWGDPDYGYDLDFGALRKDRQRLYSAEMLAALPEFDCTRLSVVDGSRLRDRHIMHKRSYLDVKLRMTDHLLGDHGDRMTMANSVEGRYPFLDIDFVRAAMVVPPAWKLRDLEEKFVLKQAAANVVPKRVAEREKFPFTAPASPYLVREAPEFVGDWLSPQVLRRQGVFDSDEVQRLCAAYRDPAYRASTPLRTDWLMIVLTFTILHDQAAGPMRRPGASYTSAIAGEMT